MLVMIFVVQNAFLRSFYKTTKLREIQTVSSVLNDCAGTEEFGPKAYSLAANYKICILVFPADRINKESETLSIEASPVCLIHHMSAQTLENYYETAVSKGGSMIETVDMQNTVDMSFFNNQEQDYRRNDSINKILSVNVSEGADSVKYVIFIESEYNSYSTVEALLTLQFFWITVVVIFFAVLTALIFSINISRPLREMNEAAKKLAKGDYEPNFKEQGYKETVELAETLNYAATEIQRSDKLQRELVANVSHDLRTPLTMISGYAEVMRDIPGENTPENVQVIIDEAGHLTALVNDMLDLSKIEAGTKKPSMTTFGLTSAVSEVMERYSQLVEHNGYTILFEADESVYVHADRTMIIQSVYNLVNNAINYGGEKKTVIVRQELFDKDGQSVSGTAGADGSYVRISVKDFGEGIAPENLRNIWDRYYKVDKEHRRAFVGTGLGLAIVRNNLQLHGARFGVESTPGNGATFWFELPTVDAE